MLQLRGCRPPASHTVGPSAEPGRGAVTSRGPDKDARHTRGSEPRGPEVPVGCRLGTLGPELVQGLIAQEA